MIRHFLEGLFQGLRAAVMKVGSGDGDVSQGGDSEKIFIRFFMGNRVAVGIARPLWIGVDQAHLLIAIPSEIDPVVTRNASETFEE